MYQGHSYSKITFANIKSYNDTMDKLQTRNKNSLRKQETGRKNTRQVLMSLKWDLWGNVKCLGLRKRTANATAIYEVDTKDEPGHKLR